jgi:protein-disulfide isomerase
VALATSAILAVDYLRDEPVFCAEGGGCAEVRRSAVAGALGVPLPLLGLAGFLALGIVSLVPGRLARWAQLGLAALGAVAGASLLFAQWRLGAWCVFCVTTDASALVAAAVAAWRLGRATGPVLPASVTVAGALLMVGFASVPILVGARKQPRYETPAAILAEIQQTPPAEVTVVDFVDFECPFCRMTHALLAPLIASHRDRVRCVRRQVPLHSHPHAQDAARAACCGDALGKGNEIADALFSAPVEDLTPQGCEKIAEGLGLPRDAYRACVADPKTDERIEADRALFKAAGGYALPTIWIDQRKLVGAQPEEALAGALDAALARH